MIFKNYYQGNGIIRSRPLPVRKKSKILSPPWWMIVECDAELGRYYRYLASLEFRAHFSIMKPLWDTHITICRGEEPPNKELFSRLDGERIRFHYDSMTLSNGKHFWLEVVSPDLLRIRGDLGLKRNPLIPFHLTFGVVEGYNQYESLAKSA